MTREELEHIIRASADITDSMHRVHRVQSGNANDRVGYSAGAATGPSCAHQLLGQVAEIAR